MGKTLAEVVALKIVTPADAMTVAHSVVGHDLLWAVVKAQRDVYGRPSVNGWAR